MVIAIDGPAGSGKSTTAKNVAEKLGFIHINTGAMYRGIALKCIQEDVNIDNPSQLNHLLTYTKFEFGYVKELTDNSHLKLHNTISKLKLQGLGYRKISKKLNEMGIKSVTGKTFYPSLVSNMWRTIKRREEKLNREVISEYTDFDIVFVETY